MTDAEPGFLRPDPIPIALAHGPLLEALHDAAFSPRGERGWTTEEFLTLVGMEGVFGFIAVAPGAEPEALGFVLARAVAGEGEILTIATRPDRCRRGVGSLLLKRTLAECVRWGAETLFLEVAEDNAPARALYEGRGFVFQGRRKGYYRRGAKRIDALVLSRTIGACGH
ncbi:MAG: GNAT family N-acetyltransferase [Rhodospirillum sp.]|nr:GNAT family N-acetyltransferase [Rhodospirillum sp.]MCF8487967.1 GNAT family N-acetyltransferase [Rhodospirillum sp.]MCF8499314.1 GNAT family N-acetyltransferase [Rhodospirillum sp.]